MDPIVRNAIETEVDTVLKEAKLMKSVLEKIGLKSTDENVTAYVVGLLTAKFITIYEMTIKREPTHEEYMELVDLLGRRSDEIRKAVMQ